MHKILNNELIFDLFAFIKLKKYFYLIINLSFFTKNIL